MEKKSVYDFFIGLLALMLALMFVIDIFIDIPNEVSWTFYYIDNIVRLIFIGDYVTRLVISKSKRNFIKKNIIDLLSIFSIRFYIRLVGLTIIPSKINSAYCIKIIKIFMLIICALKFKIRVKDEIKKSRLNFLLVLSTIFIVIGAVLISIVEGMSIGDALWWSFVTFTTVGYGDILLKTQLGKSIAVLLMIIGIGVIGVITTSITLYIANGGRKMQKSYKEKVIEDIKNKLDNYENLTNEGKRKKNYIWRVLLLVTAVGVALLPVIAWNMFVPDVLWAKIVTVVVCEGYVVFIVSMEIIQIKDELKEDMLKIGGYKITPKGSISLFKEIDFKIAQTEYSYTILISKKPLKWLYKKFYVTIYGRHGKVKKIELVRADKKYSTKYETMNGTVLEKLQEENNRFLRKCLGTPSKKSMTGVEYYYEWGQIQSFYDDRSCQTGIVIMF